MIDTGTVLADFDLSDQHQPKKIPTLICQRLATTPVFGELAAIDYFQLRKFFR